MYLIFYFFTKKVYNIFVNIFNLIMIILHNEGGNYGLKGIILISEI